jgi:hypothetical protein
VVRNASKPPPHHNDRGEEEASRHRISAVGGRDEKEASKHRLSASCGHGENESWRRSFSTDRGSGADEPRVAGGGGGWGGGGGDLGSLSFDHRDGLHGCSGGQGRGDVGRHTMVEDGALTAGGGGLADDECGGDAVGSGGVRVCARALSLMMM